LRWLKILLTISAGKGDRLLADPNRRAVVVYECFELEMACTGLLKQVSMQFRGLGTVKLSRFGV